MPVQHMTVVRYPKDAGWLVSEIDTPSWTQVREAIERMDDHEFPIVLISCEATESCIDLEGAFHIVGGHASGFALFENMGEWRFLDPDGSDEEIRLWQSDQGYFCERRAILNDMQDVLDLAWVYFDTGSYEAVDAAARRILSRPRSDGADRHLTP